MNDLVPYLLQAIGALLAVLTMILAWFGSRIQMQLDEIKIALADSERGMREDITVIDKRMTRMETHCALVHAIHKGTV